MGLPALFRLLPERLRWKLLGVVALMVVGALLELLTIGAVLPFLAAALSMESMRLGDWLEGVLAAIHPDSFVAAAIMLVVVASLAALFQIVLIRAQQGLVAQFGHHLASRLFRRVVQSSYLEFARLDPSQLVAGQAKIQELVHTYLQPLMLALTGGFLSLCIGVALAVFEPRVTLIGGAVLALIFVSILAISRRRLRDENREKAANLDRRARVTADAIGGFRDIALTGAGEAVAEEFDRVDREFRKGVARTRTIGLVPRHLIEATGIAVLALVAVLLSREEGGFYAAIPTLGVLAVGAQRLLPRLQALWLGYSAAKSHEAVVQDIAELAAGPGPERRPDAMEVAFNRQITLENISFTYPGSGSELRDIDLAIRKGECIGIVGPTGSGKSTLADIVATLIRPDSGRLLVDGEVIDGSAVPGWRDHLAYVPQDVFLTHDSIAENILFPNGSGTQDTSRLEHVLALAQLEELVRQWPDGLHTITGERGISLSGGEKQRIGIARALYRRPSLLILDEATSALDEATEAKLLHALSAIDGLTIISIAHRPSTLRQCDRIFEMESGRIVSER